MATLDEEECFLFKNLPAIKLDDGVVIYDYFSSKIAKISKENFIEGKLPDLSYNKVPTTKEFNPKKSYLTLILNKNCNMRCIYCFADGGDCNKKMSKEIIKESIKEAIKPETEELFLTFFGGEPSLCYEEIVFAVNEANKYPPKKKFAISTNGVIDDKMLDFLIKNNFAFNLSMDGTPEIQDKQRPLLGGGSSYKQVEKTIQKLVANNVSFKIRATITKESLDKMPEMIKYLSSLGVKYIHLEAVNIAGRAKKEKIEKPSANNFVSKFKECLELAKEEGVTLVNGIYTNLNNPSINSCSAVTGGKIIVTPEGYLSRCYEVQEKEHPYADQFIVGEFSEKQNKFKLDIKKIENLNGKSCNSAKECEDCFAKYICSGGCVMRNMHGLNSRNIKRIDPYQCEIIRGLLKDAIMRIYTQSQKIRPMNQKDLKKVLPWMYELAEKSFGKVIYKKLEKSIKKGFKEFPEGFVVFKEGEKIKGLLWFDQNLENKSAFIHAIYVKKEMRGKGIAQELMNYLKDYCRESSLIRIDLNVTSSLTAALKFYEKEGFKINRYQMSLDLEDEGY